MSEEKKCVNKINDIYEAFFSKQEEPKKITNNDKLNEYWDNWMKEQDDQCMFMMDAKTNEIKKVYCPLITEMKRQQAIPKQGEESENDD